MGGEEAEGRRVLEWRDRELLDVADRHLQRSTGHSRRVILDVAGIAGNLGSGESEIGHSRGRWRVKYEPRCNSRAKSEARPGPVQS